MKIVLALLILVSASPAAAQSIEGRWKPEQMSAMLLSSYIAHSGACTVDAKEGSVTMKVDAAWRPNSIRADGGNLTRRLTLERQ